MNYQTPGESQLHQLINTDSDLFNIALTDDPQLTFCGETVDPANSLVAGSLIPSDGTLVDEPLSRMESFLFESFDGSAQAFMSEATSLFLIPKRNELGRSTSSLTGHNDLASRKRNSLLETQSLTI